MKREDKMRWIVQKEYMSEDTTVNSESLFLSDSICKLLKQDSCIVVQKNIYSSRVTKFILNGDAGRTKHC